MIDKADPPGGNRVPAVGRAAAILRLLAAEPSGLGVKEIARRAGLVSSTCYQVLRALVDEGFITFDRRTNAYQTDVGLLTLVHGMIAANDYDRVVQPILDKLANDNLVTAVAAEAVSRDRMVVVAMAPAPRLISFHVSVGRRFPSFISATGRCAAAASGLSRDELQARFALLRWEHAPKFEDWYAEVKEIGSEPFAIDRGNYIRGLTIVATLLPIRARHITRSIALIGFDHHMTDQVVRQLKDNLREASHLVVEQLNET